MKPKSLLPASLACLLSLALHAQQMIEVDMDARFYVFTVYQDSATCKVQRVIWGKQGRDVFCVGTEADGFGCYQRKGHKVNDPNTVLTVNTITGDYYSITLRTSNTGFCLVITNLARRFPSYFITTTDICNLPAPPAQALHDPPQY